MNENDFARTVTRFLENDLSPLEREELVRAIESNPAYRAAFIAQVRMSVRLESFHQDPADARVVERTKALLGGRDQGHRILGEVQRRIQARPSARVRFWLWGSAAAALLIGTLVVTQLRPKPAVPIVRAPELPPQPKPVEPPKESPRETPPEVPTPVEAPKPPTVAPTEKPVPPPPPPVRETPAPKPEPEPPAPVRPEPPRETKVAVARLESATGEVFLWTPSGRKPLRAGQDLMPGEGVQTAGMAVIVFADKTRLEAGPNTTVKGMSGAGGKTLRMEKGTLRAQVAKQPADQPLTILTPQGEVKVLGTTLVLKVDESTRLEVTEGKVQLKRLSDGKSVDVAAGHYAVAAADGDLAAWANPWFIDLNDFGNADGAKPADNPVRRLYPDVSTGATGGTCVAAPGIGTFIEGPLTLTPGTWYVWVRYRDTDLGPISFQVIVDGRIVETIVGDGFLKKPWEKWNWRQASFESKAKITRLAFRSTSDALKFDRSDNTYSVVNRWDSIILTRDPRFRPEKSQ